jgi:hypothetical protein
MRLDLIPHPDHPTDIVRSVEVAVHRGQADGLVLTFGLIGDMSQIRLPQIQPAGRADGLWQATCFEAFIQSGVGDSYLEFNFSPSSQWAAYRFDGYRLGMARLDLPRVSAVRRGEAGAAQPLVNRRQLPRSRAATPYAQTPASSLPSRAYLKP